MKRLRVIFVACSLLIAIMAFFWLNRPDNSPGVAAENTGFTEKGFQVTGISEKGNLYLDDDETRLADVKTSVFSTETHLRSDDQTAWEFFFEGVLFTALPGGGIHYTPQTRELVLESGEFYWEKNWAGKTPKFPFSKPGTCSGFPLPEEFA